MGLYVPFITWITSSLSYVSFALLINGAASSFFRAGRGLRQGFPLAPLLFLIVVEGLSRELLSTKECGDPHAISFGNDISLSHVLFVDYIVMVSDGSEHSLSTLYDILQIFYKESGMLINDDKSSILHSGLDVPKLITVQNIFSFSVTKLEFGLKYLGFHLKPCRYLLKGWDWLVAKAKKRIKNWSY